MSTIEPAVVFAPGALSVATVLAALLICLLGAGVGWRGRGGSVSLWFFLVSLLAGGWLGCYAVMYAATTVSLALPWARAGYAFGALIPATVLQFAATLVGRRRSLRIPLSLAWTFSILVAIVGGLTSVLIPSVRRFAWGYYPAARPFSSLMVLGFASIIIGSIYLLWVAYRRAEGKGRERAGALLLAFVLGSVGMCDYLPAAGVDLQPIGFVATLTFVIVAATAVWRFELADITPEYAAGQILETMKSAVIVSDMDGWIRVANRAAEQLLGYHNGAMQGMRLREVLDRSEDLTTGKLINSRGLIEQSMAWRTAGGGPVDVLATSSLLREDGNPVGVVYVASDFTERKRAEEELRESEQRYRELFENANDLVYTHDLEGLITSVNKAGERISGYSHEELVGRPIESFVVPEHADRAREALAHKLRGEATSTFYEVEMISRDGRRIPLELSTRLIYREERAVGVQGIGRDVSERKESEARYRLLFERNLAGVYRTGADGRIIECNEACARIFGFDSREEILAASAEDFYFDDTERSRVVQMLREQKQVSNLELRLRRKDGSAVWVLENISLLEGDVLEGTIIDITDRKIVQEQMEYQAYHDALTGLPNRLLFRDRIAVGLARARRAKRMSAVMFLDLDQFKHVNDTLGHTVGDRLLQAIGSRLVNCVRSEDTVARMGGDEFTILLADIADRRGAAAVAQKVLDSVRQPVAIDEHELYVSTSVGIALFPDDGEDSESLLKSADRAMYRAKELGRDNFQYTGPRLEITRGRLELEKSLRQALERNELVVHYQPMVEIATGRVVGAEALVRWNHPESGLMQPDEFIPLAEATQLIIPLGAWVLRTACAQMKAWHDAGHEWLRLAVNLSPRQFLDGQLYGTVERILRETGFPPGHLDLEITETTAMDNVEVTLSILARLKELGIRISIDDFGTGYSSLSHLKRFPIDTVKIDQDFVRDLTRDDAAIISAVISMARALNLRVIAEGVETEEQLAFLRREECAEMQGFLYSHPLPAVDFEKALAVLTSSSPIHWLDRLRLT